MIPAHRELRRTRHERSESIEKKGGMEGGREGGRDG